MELNLVVLKSPAPAALADFYRRVGMVLERERHGDGPEHFSAALGAGVLEIYPAREPGRATFGLRVVDVEAFRAAWQAAGGRSGKADGVLIDPEGNVLIITAAES